MILCVGTTPAVQRVMVFEHVTHDAVNRAAVTLDGAAGKAVNVAKVLRALGGRGRRGQRVEPDGRGRFAWRMRNAWRWRHERRGAVEH